MPCRDCLHFQSSDEANKPRPGLTGFGYCKAAPTNELKARFFREESVCWQVPNAYQERRK